MSFHSEYARSATKSPLVRPIGLGCMRLSTERDRDEDRAIGLLHAAFEEGITFLDTADAYCLDESEAGHNERLIARALQAWSGDRSRIVIATKGGLTRPRGEWVPDGRGRHLRAACEASLRALGVGRIHLYQLHAPDTRTPLSTSVRALAALRNEGLVERIGLCNVNVSQIEEVRRITEISAVQVELSLWRDTNVLNGVVQSLHRTRTPTDRVPTAWRSAPRAPRAVRSTAGGSGIRHGATAHEIALAWLKDLSDAIVTVPGPTRLETVRSVVRAHDIELTDEDRARLDSQIPWAQSDSVRRCPLLLQAGLKARLYDCSETERSCSSWGCPGRARAPPRVHSSSRDTHD